ncbi:hypothetical protein CPT_Sycamore_008 [Streptomyces phage Sycamore]|uniref:Uncharacterized protein n=1 Tax=Streptomyces phage Sycamore TaxID=2767589 RepID=A0A873WHE9_9CAUD|nr:hypothetical protein CPT_Sycamore_008 [Streptomyces phage Sycamore]
MATVKNGLGKRIANMPGVNDAVHEDATRRAYKVRSAASGHILSGEFQRSIKVVKASGPHRRQDWLVAITHPWAISINWGHIDSRSGRPVRGIHAIEKGLE